MTISRELAEFATGYGAGSFAVGRNRIINGDMRIDQRNAGASVAPTADNTYTLDRWAVFLSQASKFSVQQNAGSVTPPEGFVNYLGCTSLSAYTVGASERFLIQQNIEGLNASDLAWGTAGAKTVTLSFWVRSSLTGTFGGVLKNSDSNRSYPYTYSISVADTWEYKTITVPGDTTGTWLTTNGIGIRVVFGIGVGSTFSGTAGAWAGANYNSATGATSVVGTNGATFYITGVQLEEGTVATPFERRQYGQELALCQRYYEVFYSPGADLFLWNIEADNAGGFRRGAFYYKVEKRAVASIVLTWSGTPGTARGVQLNETYAVGPYVNGIGSSNYASLYKIEASAEL